MKTHWIKNIGVGLTGMLFFGIAWAQGGVDLGPKEAFGDFKPNLGNMEKPISEPTIIDNKVETKDLTYDEKQIKAETKYEPLEVKAPQPIKAPMDELKNNLVKISFGRFASPYAKLWLNSGRNLKSRVAFDFSHASSSKGYVDYAEWRDDEGGIKGEYFTKDNTLSAGIRMKNSNYFYFFRDSDR